MSGEFGTGKTIFVLAIVVGCFAVLWPKIFYPMLTASVKHPTSARQVSWRNEANLHFADQLCYLLEEHYVTAVPSSTPSAASSSSSSSSSISGVRWSAEECWLMVWQTCGHEMNESLVEDVRLGRDKSNLTECLTNHFGLTPSLVASAAPPRVRLRPYLPQSMGGHARPERPAHLYPEMMHPALREKGRAMPQRTIDKQARPGPMPGIRPPMGGAGGMVPPPQGKGSGAMGIIMPLYTVGIVVFFVYTIMKVLFKKGPDDDKTPKLKDFGLDPEYRKYVFAEEYLDNAEISTRDQMRRQAREESRSRKKVQQDQVPDTKIGQRRLPSEGGLDTQGKKLGKSECDKISTAISGILAELDQFSSELETRQQQKKEELSRMMMMEREKRNNECKHETQQKRDRIGLDSVMETAAASAANADKKEEVGDITSEEELTSSEALTTTMSEDNSLPTSLQQHLHALQVEQLNSYSELSVDVIPQEEGEQVPSTKTEAQLDLITDEGEVETVLPEQKEVTVDPTLYQSTVDTLALCKELEVEISELQVNVDVPQKEEVADTSSPSPKQTDLAQEEGNVEGGHEEEEQVATPADVEQGQLDVVELEEDKLQSAEPKELEPPSAESKEDEPQSTEPKEVEPQSAEPKEVEPQSAEPKEVEPQSTEPKEAEPQSAESKEVEPQSAEPKEVEPQSAEPKEVEPQSAEPKEDEPQSAEPKEVELQPAEHQKVEPQPAEPEEVESQPAEPKEVEPQPAEPKEIETESAEPKEDEPQTAEPIEDGNQHEVIQEEEVVNEEQKVNLPLETEQQESAEKQIMEESKVSREDAVPKVTSEDTEQKQAEPANTCEETPQPAAKDSTTCIMTFISDTADQLGKVVSDEEPQKEDPGTPDEAEASPVPLLKEIAARTPKLSPDDAQGANAEAEDSSEATETGADISDLKSFAEESHAHEKQHLVEEIPAPIPEEEYCPSIRVGLMDEAESEESAVLCKGQGTQTSLAMSLTPPQAVSKEHSTQTDEEQGVAVLGVQTSFLHDEGGVETKAGSHGPVKTEGVTEILLDALLPSETQLLIKDTQVVGSKPSQNVEIDASEAEGVPCIVTSHVSLAFVGLDSQKPENLTLISADGKKTESMKAVSVKSEPAAAQTPVSQESKTDCEQKPESLIDKNKATEMQAACQKDITVDAKHTEESNQTGKDTESADRCHTAPKASEQELEPKEIQNEVGNEPLPDSPSLEAIAEAVAAATTRAALDLLATTNSDTLIKPQEVKEAVSSPSILSKESPNLLPKTADTASLENTKAVTSESEEEERKPSEQVTEASRSQTQGDAPQSSTVYVATVTHTPSESPSSTPEKEKTQESVEADLIKASLPQAETPPETVKTSQSGAVPPVPISQGVVVTKTVEAALAEAAEEVCDISMNKETKHQDTTATQDHQGVATVSPNEDSPISSKGSSPDMEEYEVINKDEDTAHKLRTQRETSSGEPVIDKVKAAESTEVSSQAAQLHTGEEAPSEKENETQKEEKVVKGKERSRSKEPEEKKSSDKANICEDQGKDSPSCPVDDSSSAKATDPEASHCTPSDSLGAEEGQTDIDSSTSKENVSSDNADSE
ncbi:titin-like isoform X8 [Penaeus japonicus]|uniref:titin-like isoform X8 n=1 Tax=Penaeus japonicus TaxID=27405 RepID=UPI001C716914|nr:titin-like isoform X8 [Penaeus japonicus]